MDNAGVGIAYGVRKIKIPWYSNGMIAIISFLASVLAGFAGNFISRVISPSYANIIGTIVIVTVGIWVMFQPYQSGKPKQSKRKHFEFMTRILQKPEEADIDHSSTISLTESVILGIALALNALAGGFDAGVTKQNILLTAFSVGLFSYGLLDISTFVGERYAVDRLGDKATIIAGMLLIVVGIRQMV